MKKGFFIAAFLMVVFFTACEVTPATTTTTIQGTRTTKSTTVTGTITVQDESYWTNLYVGLFYKSTNETEISSGLKSLIKDETNNIAVIYQHYNDLGFYNTNSILPIEYGTISHSGTNGEYSLAFPDNPHESGQYLMTAWLDTDGDEKLTMVNFQQDSCEFNHCSVKEQVGTNYIAYYFFWFNDYNNESDYEYTWSPYSYLVSNYYNDPTFEMYGTNGFNFILETNEY